MAARGPRVDPAEVQALPLRAHAFLSDAPLHDTWRFRLHGADSDISIRDVLDRFAEFGSNRIGLTARALFALRKFLGRLFGWDRPDPTSSERSYIHRLTAEDRGRTSEAPGSSRGFWTTVYTFEREARGEVINRTVHSFLLFALESRDGEQFLYMGVYVKPVSRFTRYYMMLIDPFRRLLLYPALAQRFEAVWRDRSSTESRS